MPFLFLLAFLFPALHTFDSKVEWHSPTTHDFGDIIHRQPVSHNFSFKNKSDAPITIDNVRTTCGCTVPDWSEAPILPDSLGIISVEYDARDVGYFKKQIKVYFQGQRKAEKLSIEGFVEGGR